LRFSPDPGGSKDLLDWALGAGWFASLHGFAVTILSAIRTIYLGILVGHLVQECRKRLAAVVA
jgi:hypothetical protein